jgi:hypothetical protein
MAAKRGGLGRPFKKGQTGNPNGSSARMRSRQLQNVARMTADEVAQIGTLILDNDRDALRRLGENPNASVLQVWMAGLVIQSMKKGDATIFRAVLDRVVGKALERQEVTGKDGAPLAMDVATRELTEDEMRQRADELARQRAKAGDD